MKKITYKIFCYDNLDMGALYDYHVNLISPKKLFNEHSNFLDVVTKQYAQKDDSQIIKYIPRKKELVEKYSFMVHLLITKCFHKGYVDLPSSYLKFMFGDSYRQMLVVLNHFGYISRNGYYQPGESVRRIFLLQHDNIICQQKYDPVFEKYYKKYLKKRQSIHRDRKKRMIKEHGKTFVEQYIRTLEQLKLVDEKGARNYILNNTNTTLYSKDTNLYILDQYTSGNHFINIDKDNRIYSILSNTNRNLRSYLNINYIVDITNCHPLLFCKYIVDQYNITINTLSILNSIDIDILFNTNTIYSIQYDSKVFCKLLNNNGIYGNELGEISIDELLYISLTFQGRFWEYIMNNERFRGTDRSEIKEKMFQEVFYSRVLRGHNMMFQDEFQQMFPHVFQTILDHRRKVKNGTEIHLAHYLMKLESEIIHSSLRTLYSMKFSVLNIHDAIVVLDTDNNKDLLPDTVESVIKEESLKHKLFIKCKIEKFGQ